MNRISTSFYLLLSVLVVLFCFVAIAQEKSATHKTMKTITPVGTGAIDGKGLFQDFCAVCHGKDARGDGPAVAALKTPASDLTQIAARNKGKFPDTRILAILNGDAPAGAHGNREMPIWGKAFNDMSPNLSVSQGRKHALVTYLETIQAK